MRVDLKNKTVQDSIVVFLLGLALGAYSLIGFFTAAVKTKWFMSPYLFPLLLSVLALLLALSLVREGRGEAGQTASAETVVGSSAQKLKHALAVVLMAAAYAVLIPRLHFIPASILFLAALIWLMGERRWWMIAAVALIMPFALYALFGLALGVRLP